MPPWHESKEFRSARRHRWSCWPTGSDTALVTLVNLNRLNTAFGIGSAGFSEGMVCLVPDRPPASETAAGTPAGAASVPPIAGA